MDPTVAQKIEDFFDDYTTKQYAKGQVLIRAHDEPAHIYHLISGKVKQYDISYRGDEVILNVFKPPAFFPMSCAINRTLNLYFYEAETDVELRIAPLDETIDFLKSNPDVLYDLLARVYLGTDGLLGRIAHLMAGTARSRVLYELLIESRRFGEPRGRGIAIALTEGDVAARAGLARETVSREIRKLKDDGLISVIKNDIFVNDLDRLAESVSREL
jgi:CRP-like cAMP-binding protein